MSGLVENLIGEFVKEISDANPFDITPEEASKMSIEETNELCNQFTETYGQENIDRDLQKLLEKVGKTINDQVTIIYCGGKIIKEYDTDIYEIPNLEEDISKIQEKYGKVCLVISNVSDVVYRYFHG